MKIPDWVSRLSCGDKFLAYFPYSGKYEYITVLDQERWWLECCYTEDPYSNFNLYFDKYNSESDPENWLAYQVEKNASDNSRK